MQSENFKMKNVLSERLLDFGVEIIRMVEKIRSNYAGRQIIGQLIRSSTSAGANYEEACGAESRSDFVHKLQIVLKELRESLYWLQLILNPA
jgi:four helix bundle protein